VSLIVLAGLPGSGKSTIAESIACDTDSAIVSVDDIRLRGGNVIATIAGARRQVESLLGRHRSVVVDACNIRANTRRAWLNLGRDAGATCELVVVDTPVALCRARNAARPLSQQVDDDSYDRYLADATTLLASVAAEGWDCVRVVAVDRHPADATSRTW
jgi:predicted kinase